MSDKFLLNLLYVLAALAFWLLPVLLRWLRRRKEAAGQPQGPEPFPEVEEEPQGGSLVDPFGEHLEQLVALMGAIDGVEAEVRELRQACSGPGLSRFDPLIDEAVAGPVQAVRGALQAGIDDPGATDPYRLIADTHEALARARSAAAFIARSVREHGREGHAQGNERGVALARIFLARLESFLHRGAGPPAEPLFLPVEQAFLLPPDLMGTLARSRAVPFDAPAGSSRSPRMWAAIAVDVARWAYHATPGLEEELEERYAVTLEGLGYRTALPPEGLVREVFIHALTGLYLGPVYARAVETEAGGVGSEDIARRMHELSLPQDEQEGELAVPIEILLHVLHREPLSSLSGHRLTDISPLRFGTSDGENAAAAARALRDGQEPAETKFHVVAGAILAALDHPQAAPAIISAVDRVLGLERAVDVWKEPAPAPRRRPERDGRFVSARAVREAIVVGALMER